MKDEKEIKGTKGSTTNKIRKLERQYEKILVDLFDQFAAESIEEALDQNEGSFGENLQGIVQCALECLKGKVMQELGVSGDVGGDSGSESGGGAVDAIMGGMGLGGLSIGDGMGSMNSENGSEDDEEDESEESEKGESEESESEEDEDEDEDELEEKAPAMAQKKYNESNESIVREKEISSSRRGDQVSLTEAYMSMYPKDTK
jgi:TATA-binding protein-associated factor Taf7